ncbi:hypothetical protein L1987_82617 [Smallanthus sonchifolius]|uniref:Uncharacterized protein n=1 Tax=Smallanthus sonchifolius TaxID=185202 RepID=A0ACB8YC02_9ASTR|nr:hypothetical protein L1987_82617 [Smallanthus sonchifolius]
MMKIKACYVLTEEYDDAEIVEMMVIDTCFILEFVLKICEYDHTSYPGGILLARTIHCDMVLLENQLILRNLIAYEQSFQTPNSVTSYAQAMDMLVSTEEDVAKLADSGVLVNFMGSNKEAAKMINNICKNVICVEFFYGKEWETLNKYCNSYWPKHIAKMRSTYFSSPWNMIALLAGIMLFVLTMIQIIFTVKSAGSNK